MYGEILQMFWYALLFISELQIPKIDYFIEGQLNQPLHVYMYSGLWRWLTLLPISHVLKLVQPPLHMHKLPL